MSMDALRVTFYMDGTGVFMWPKTPIHLDGLLSWALMPFHRLEIGAPAPNEEPFEIKLPLGTWKKDGHWGWHASALFPDGEFYESTQYYRKKIRTERLHLTSGAVGTQSGRYAERNTPMPLILCNKLIGYCLGKRKRIAHILKKQTRYIGAMASAGKGKVLGVEVDVIDDDFSIKKDGRMMRYMPAENGLRTGRIRPPYHNNFDSVTTCYPGDEF